MTYAQQRAEIVQLAKSGMTQKQIAEALGVQPKDFSRTLKNLSITLVPKKKVK